MTNLTDASPLARLRTLADPKLPASLREEILDLGTDAVPALLALLDDEALHADDAPGNGWPPIHAVDLLADLRAVEAIPSMLNILVTGEDDEILFSRVELRLSDLGAPVLEPALALLTPDRPFFVYSAIASVVAQLGVRDRRIFPKLLEVFEADELLGAIVFGAYGDPKALPLIEKAIADFELDFETRSSLMGLPDLVQAYEKIAEPLPDALRDHVDDQYAAWDEAFDAAQRRAKKKIGRNDPCPCASGKKFKRCCIDETVE